MMKEYPTKVTLQGEKIVEGMYELKEVVELVDEKVTREYGESCEEKEEEG
jgi:hypothetical protein